MSGTTSHKHLPNDRLVLCVKYVNMSLLQEVVPHVTELSKPQYCTFMICSANDVEILCWYCLICYAHMSQIYTIFADFRSLCKTILSIKLWYRLFYWLVYLYWHSQFLIHVFFLNIRFSFLITPAVYSCDFIHMPLYEGILLPNFRGFLLLNLDSV